MASKRSLYRPAPENVTSKQTRHFLAQGRLTTKPSLPDSLTVYASPHHLQRPLADEGGDASTIISHAPIDDGSLSPRQQMAAYVHSPQQSMSSASYIDTPISDSLTRSPAKPKPEQLLELSDSDEEITFHKKKVDGLRPRHSSGARQMKSPDNISGMEDIVMLPDFGEQAVLPLETSANRSSTLKSVDEKSGSGVKKKKPKGRIVSSRYMQGFNTTLPSKPNVTTNRDSETHSKMMRKTATTSSKGRPVSKLHTKPRRSLVTSTPFAGTLGTIPVNSPMFSGDGSYFQPPSAIKTDSKKSRPKSRQAVGLPSPMDITSKTPASFIDVEASVPQYLM
ncbi:uncharacterized protein LOC102805301 [Saccoglossus kowalevskii]|uniref:Uncharacterized protein LOC102805301 n=1 Tax=Saccoglossus kowalevskii TaxID=10224 RepID=A0ABM0MY11_SACKO|nr:PREDICTED: uncharacterized protein LOC102805301 [Saccoglossus kowalevskii]